MSHLQYSSYPGFGEYNYENFHYSSAVRIPPAGETIHISGQGGWERSTGALVSTLEEQISKAFDNVDHTIVNAGGRGIASVFKFVIYYSPMSDDALKFTVENLRKWFPTHRPLWTAIGVEKLALPEMMVEVEASAHLN